MAAAFALFVSFSASKRAFSSARFFSSSFVLIDCVACCLLFYMKFSRIIQQQSFFITLFYLEKSYNSPLLQ
jgi:hypothetical protein